MTTIYTGVQVNLAIVVEGLLKGYARKSHARKGHQISITQDLRMMERRFPLPYEDKKHKQNCSVCSIRPAQCTKKGKGLYNRKKATYYSNNCPEINCFEIYHTQRKYKKKNMLVCLD